MFNEIIALALGGVFSWGLPDLPPPMTQSGNVHVVSSEHRIEFPHRIVLNLEAESVDKVVNVELFYRIADQNTLIYTYPRRLKITKVLSAEFVIPTGVPEFIPSGVKIEYYYVFWDAEREIMDSEKFTLEYLDPKYQWERYDAGLFDVLWHDRPRHLVESVADETNIRLAPVISMFMLHEQDAMKAVVVNDRREAKRTFPLISRTATEEQLFGGFAFGNFDVFIISGLESDGWIHELSHLLLDQALGSPRVVVPAWLSEGVAMYFESRTFRPDMALKKAVKSGDLIGLDQMSVVPGQPSDVYLFYAQSRSFVAFLIDKFGEDRMSAMFGAMNRGQPVDEALLMTYGQTNVQLESAWHAELNSTNPLMPVIDLASRGTSVIIGGALLATVIIITLRCLIRVRTQ